MYKALLPSISMVDSVTCLRYAECSSAPDHIINGYIPAAHGHWCAFTDLYHAIPYHMVARCRQLTPWYGMVCHGMPCARSCLSVRTQPLTATGAPSQTSTIPYHTIPCPLYQRKLLGDRFISEDPLRGGVRGSNKKAVAPWPSSGTRV